jgi:hypothetical protein
MQIFSIYYIIEINYRLNKNTFFHVRFYTTINFQYATHHKYLTETCVIPSEISFYSPESSRTKQQAGKLMKTMSILIRVYTLMMYVQNT